eukprot:TRINITY_DN10178_c0_g1_i1.p1 TRINITY_DN10178_c0_g1~~TRINITY_DN10178_c0_g1_i1.p1  ORF type:complete len:210 (+),score=68.49 TRINITY_DN10178_c0_g1_i1:13-642(+)
MKLNTTESRLLVALSQLPDPSRIFLPNITLNHFVHAIIDEICHKESARQSEHLSSLIIPSIKPQSITIIVESFRILITNIISFNLDESQIHEELGNINISDIYAESLCECVLARSDEIRSAFISHATTKMSQSYLSDFDWKLQVTMSSDKISNLRQPVLLLSLFVRDGGSSITSEDKPKEILLELPMSDLDTLLSGMGDINEIIKKLSA